MTRLSRAARAELLDAWEAWDAKALRVRRRPPADWLRAETDRYRAAGRAAAAEFGPDVWEADLHAQLIEQRRDGATYDQALTAVEADYTDQWEDVA